MEDNYQGYDPSQNQTQGQNSDYQQNYGYQNQQNYGYQGQPGSQNQYGYQQGYQYGNQPPVKPSNNLVWAILTTICCCLPFGIVSIVYAAKVRKKGRNLGCRCRNCRFSDLRRLGCYTVDRAQARL